MGAIDGNDKQIRPSIAVNGIKKFLGIKDVICYGNGIQLTGADADKRVFKGVLPVLDEIKTVMAPFGPPELNLGRVKIFFPGMRA